MGVFLIRDNLKMIGIYARPIATEMIELHPFGD